MVVGRQRRIKYMDNRKNLCLEEHWQAVRGCYLGARHCYRMFFSWHLDATMIIISDGNYELVLAFGSKVRLTYPIIKQPNISHA